MNTDDFTKLLLAIAVSFAIVILAFGLFRILNNLAGSIQDFRRAIKNISNISDLVVEDYSRVREELYSVLKGVKDFKSSFVDPVRSFTKIASAVTPFLNRAKRNADKAE